MNTTPTPHLSIQVVNFADEPPGDWARLSDHAVAADRAGVESVLVDAFEKFEGDLAGKFYPLETMTKEDQDQLIADHFLFK